MNNSRKRNLTYVTGNKVNLERRGLSFSNTLSNSFLNKVFPPRQEFGVDLTNEQNKPLDSATEKRHYWFPPTFLQ